MLWLVTLFILRDNFAKYLTIEPTQLLFRLSPGHTIYVLLRRSLALDLVWYMCFCSLFCVAATSPLLADSSTDVDDDPSPCSSSLGGVSPPSVPPVSHPHSPPDLPPVTMTVSRHRSAESAPSSVHPANRPHSPPHSPQNTPKTTIAHRRQE